jgi:hypothetical protein
MWIMGQIRKSEKQELVELGWEVTELNVKQFNKLLDPKNKGEDVMDKGDILVSVWIDNDVMSLMRGILAGN